MFTFIISVILTSFICLCFYKKNFWEHRYIVLLISGCVALIATLAINFSARGRLQTKTEIVYNKAMKTFYMPKDLIIANFDTVKAKLNFIKHYNWYGDHNASTFYKENDSVKAKMQTPVTIVLYSWGKHLGNHCVGIMTTNGNQHYYDLDEIYLMKSSGDSIAYVSKKRQYYDVKPNSWITGFSLPRKSTITVLHVPPREFVMIPDSLIRPIPF